MSEYYTNVAMHGQNLLVRGIRDGQEFRSKIKYSPTLYIQSAKQTGYTDIYGNSLKPLPVSYTHLTLPTILRV